MVSITNICYVLEAFIQDRRKRALKVRGDILAALIQLSTSVEALVNGVRTFTGDIRSYDGKPYGKGIHLMTRFKTCIKCWVDLNDDEK